MHVSHQNPSVSSIEVIPSFQNQAGGVRSALEMRRAPWTARTAQGRRPLPVYLTVSDEWCVRKSYWAVGAGRLEVQESGKAVRAVRRNGNAHGAWVEHQLSVMVVAMSTCGPPNPQEVPGIGTPAREESLTGCSTVTRILHLTPRSKEKRPVKFWGL